MKRFHKNSRPVGKLPAVLGAGLLSLLLLFYGCAPGSLLFPQEKGESSTVSSENSLPTVSSRAEEPKPEPEPAPQPAFLEKGEKAASNLRKLALEGTSFSDGPSIYPFGKNLLLYWSTADQEKIYFHLMVYDPYNAQVEAQRTISVDTFMNAPVISGEYVAIFDGEAMILLDSSLKEKARYTQVPNFYSCWLAPQGDVMFFQSTGTSGLLKASLSSKGGALTCRTVLEQLGPVEISGSGNKGQFLLVKGLNSLFQLRYLAVDPYREQVVAQAPIPGYGSVGFDGETFYLDGYQQEKSAQFMIPALPAEASASLADAEKDVFFSSNTLLHMGESGYLLEVTYQEETNLYTAYNRQGEAVSSFSYFRDSSERGRLGLSGDWVYLPEENCFVCLYIDPDEECGLLFWLLDAPSSETSLSVLSSAVEEPELQYPNLRSLYQRAETMSKKYGLEIQVGEKVNLTEAGYQIEPLLSKTDIRHALDLLEQALARYPENFFRQLPYGDLYTIRIGLTGSLTSPGGETLTQAGGYVTQSTNTMEMAVDARQDYLTVSTFYHEFSHMIDRKLEYISLYKPDSLFSEETWSSFNPDGFTYLETYSEDVYPYQDYERFYSYFISSYSMTYPTEDRAQLMEDAMSEDWSIWGGGIQNNPPMQEKFEYYCRCIRDGFSTEGWPEVTAWEECLYK